MSMSRLPFNASALRCLRRRELAGATVSNRLDGHIPAAGVSHQAGCGTRSCCASHCSTWPTMYRASLLTPGICSDAFA